MRLRNLTVALRQQLQQWTASTTSSRAAPAEFRAKESFAFAGFANPDAALESVMWAATTGNAKALLDSLSPEALRRSLRTNSTEEAAALVAKHANEVSGYRVLRHEALDAEHIAALVYYNWADTAGGQLEEIILRRVGTEWKYDGHLEGHLPFQVGVAREQNQVKEPDDQ